MFGKQPAHTNSATSTLARNRNNPDSTTILNYKL